MGGKSKSTSRTDNSIDPWSRSQYEQGRSAVRGILSSNPFQAYEGQMVAPSSQAEMQALNDYSGTTGYAGGILQNAIDGAGQAFSGGPQSIEARSFANFDPSIYANPYDDMVMDRAMSDMDRARQITMNDTESGVHRSAFGGARHGVSDSLTNERFIDQVGNFSAQLRRDGYDRALGLYGQDMDRSTNADMFNVGQQNLYDQGILARSGALAGMAGQYGDQSAREAQIMTALGGNQRMIDQAGLDAQYQEFLRAQEDPYRRAQIEMGILGSTPIITDSSSSATQRTNPGLAGILGTGLQAASGLGWSPLG